MAGVPLLRLGVSCTYYLSRIIIKNQYTADINDYHKYGLLRTLSNLGEWKSAVCWMLTDGDGGTNGAKLSYLQKPDLYRKYDPELFDELKCCIEHPVSRNVHTIENSGILPNTVFHFDRLGDVRQDRLEYMSRFLTLARKTQLVFFDPDMGMEVKSCRYGAKSSCQYLYWNELKEAFDAGHSVLIYQHFPRQEHAGFVKTMGQAMHNRIPCEAVVAFQTSSVVFLLLIQKHHWPFLRDRVQMVEVQWSKRIKVSMFTT